MDTINNLANAATKAIWGEGQHEEPVSGKTGNVAAGEPYDAGNIGENNEAALKTSDQRDTKNQDVAHIPSEPAPAPKTTGTSAPEPMPKPEPDVATKPRFVEAKDDETNPITTTTNAPGAAKLAPSAGIAMRGDSSKAQNDTRPPPSSDTQSAADTTTSTTPAAIPGTKTAENTTAAGIPGTGTAATTTSSKDEAKSEAKNDQPAPTIDDHHAEVTDKKNLLKDDSAPDVKLVGPGPRPLEEIARKHGGDAAAATPTPAAAAAGTTGDAGGQQRRRDSGKSVGGEEEGAGVKAAHPAGAEEHVVKSSGLAADGGDFDASRPGAGREADRLLDAKGVHHGNPHGGHGGGTTETKTTGTRTSTEAGAGNGHGHGHGAGHHGTENGGKEKVGLKEKIKAKLHKSSTSTSA